MLVHDDGDENYTIDARNRALNIVNQESDRHNSVFGRMCVRKRVKSCGRGSCVCLFCRAIPCSSIFKSLALQRPIPDKQVEVMVLGLLKAIAACPAIIGTSEAVRQGQRKNAKEKHRDQKSNLLYPALINRRIVRQLMGE